MSRLFSRRVPVITAAAIVCMSVLMMGQERDRARVEDKYKWNLADIYPSVAAWRTEKQRITAEIPQVRSFAGKLGSSPQVLADALGLSSGDLCLLVDTATMERVPADAFVRVTRTAVRLTVERLSRV